jgi:hypothetical protein
MQSSYLPATTESIAKAQEAKDASEYISILYQALEDPSTSAEALRTKELAITNLTNYLTKENRAEDLRDLLTKLRHFFALIPRQRLQRLCEASSMMLQRYLELLSFRSHSARRWWNGHVQRSVPSSGSEWKRG